MEKELQGSSIKNQIVAFSGSDKEKLFKNNLKVHKKIDWVYKHKPITYKYNEHGFRNNSFDKVNWTESIVVFGCSNVEGVGLVLEDTLCYQLEKILKIPVVNLGVGGSAVDFASWNSMRLYKYYPKPKAVVQVWTSLARYTDYNDGKFARFTPQNENFNFHLDWSYRSKMYIESDRILWKEKLPYIEASFFKDNYEDQSEVIILPVLDRGRDLLHPGIKSNRAAAQMIVEQFLKQRIQLL